MTFTVTDTGSEFVNKIAALTDSKAGRGGLVTLKDFGWVHIAVRLPPAGNPRPADAARASGGATVSIPDRTGDFVKKRMDACTGAEILEEVLRQLRFDAQLDAIMASSICVPCYMPYVNNVWLPWSRGDMPPSGSGGVDQSRTYRPVRRHAAGK